MAVINKIKVGTTDYNVGTSDIVTCSTAAGTAAKTADLTGFSLVEGATIHVKFTNANTANNPTLNINSTGAKAIVKYGTTNIDYSWPAGAVVPLTYTTVSSTGYWVVQSDVRVITSGATTPSTGTLGQIHFIV